MKHLLLVFAIVTLLVFASPSQAQVNCTPPQDAQLVAVNVTGQYTAWAAGNVVTWCSVGGLFTSYEGSYIDTLYWDGYWLPYNLYFGYSVDGYLFQMNVSTGQGYLISPHGQPSGDPGEGGGGGGGQGMVIPEVLPETPATQHHRYFKPSVVNRLTGAWWERL